MPWYCWSIVVVIGLAWCVVGVAVAMRSSQISWGEEPYKPDPHRFS